MKKIIYGVLLCTLSLIIIPAVAESTTETTNREKPYGFSGSKNLIGASGDGELQKGSDLLDTAKKTVNWLLGMLATIALVICLYGGFLMVTAAGNDSNYKKGITILKQAAIGLAIIGLAWLIVSVVFWLVAVMSAT